MTEYEKSQKGLAHFFDGDMMAKSRKASELTRKYNTSGNSAVQSEILKELIGHMGKNVGILPDFHCEFGCNITIGNNVFINYNCSLMDNTEITIGDDVLFGPNVSLYSVNHSIDPEERAKLVCINKSIHIGNKVWLCGDVVVTAGVSIGDGSVIGAGSVVTKDIPASVVAAGNPCRVIRKISEKDILGYFSDSE